MVIISKSSEKANDSVTKWDYILVLKSLCFRATWHTWHKTSMFSFRILNEELRYHLGHVYWQPILQRGMIISSPSNTQPSVILSATWTWYSTKFKNKSLTHLWFTLSLLTLLPCPTMECLPVMGRSVLWALEHQESEKSQRVSHALYSFLNAMPKNCPEFPIFISALVYRVGICDHSNSLGF